MKNFIKNSELEYVKNISTKIININIPILNKFEICYEIEKSFFPDIERDNFTANWDRLYDYLSSFPYEYFGNDNGDSVLFVYHKVKVVFENRKVKENYLQILNDLAQYNITAVRLNKPHNYFFVYLDYEN